MARHRVAALRDLWSGELVRVQAGKHAVVLVRLDDAVHAYADRCAHLGVALSGGTLTGTLLTCSAHHWQYDVTTGRGVNPTHACLMRFPVTIDDGEVYVEVPP